MKKIGIVLIAFGLGVLAFVLYVLLFQNRGIISPVPDSQGVKILYITPGSR